MFITKISKGTKNDFATYDVCYREMIPAGEIYTINNKKLKGSPVDGIAGIRIKNNEYYIFAIQEEGTETLKTQIYHVSDGISMVIPVKRGQSMEQIIHHARKKILEKMKE